jgi:hypothetical protein
VKKLRSKLTYANVMASLAVFLVLGGATAWAALGKNTVGTKQLKNNAVTTGKIKSKAVTTAKIKDGAVTGAKVNLGSLGTVPSATNATNATNAGNANTVAGSTIRRFFYASGSSAAVTSLASLNGLTINATCPGGNLEAFATTSVLGADVHSGGSILFEEESFYNEDDFFTVGDEFEFLAAAEADSNEGTMTYTTPGGAVVTVVFLAEEGGLGSCVLAGTMTG